MRRAAKRSLGVKIYLASPYSILVLPTPLQEITGTQQKLRSSQLWPYGIKIIRRKAVSKNVTCNKNGGPSHTTRDVKLQTAKLSKPYSIPTFWRSWCAARTSKDTKFLLSLSVERLDERHIAVYSMCNEISEATGQHSFVSSHASLVSGHALCNVHQNLISAHVTSASLEFLGALSRSRVGERTLERR